MNHIISAVTNIYSLIAFILLLVAFVLLRLRIIEQRLFRGLAAVFIVWLLAISSWMIYQNQTKQGGQQQNSPPVSQQPAQVAAATGNSSSQTGIQITVNQSGGQTSVVAGNNSMIEQKQTNGQNSIKATNPAQSFGTKISGQERTPSGSQAEERDKQVSGGPQLPNREINNVNAELTSFFDSISTAIAAHDWTRVRQSFHPYFKGASASGGFDRDKEIELIKAALDVRLKYLGIEKMNEDNSLLVKVSTNIRGDLKTEIYRLVKEEGSWLIRERKKG